MSTAMGRLVGAELKLMVREPLTLIFVFAFPVVTMLIMSLPRNCDKRAWREGESPVGRWAEGK